MQKHSPFRIYDKNTARWAFLSEPRHRFMFGSIFLFYMKKGEKVIFLNDQEAEFIDADGNVLLLITETRKERGYIDSIKKAAQTEDRKYIIVEGNEIRCWKTIWPVKTVFISHDRVKRTKIHHAFNKKNITDL